MPGHLIVLVDVLSMRVEKAFAKFRGRLVEDAILGQHAIALLLHLEFRHPKHTAEGRVDERDVTQIQEVVGHELVIRRNLRMAMDKAEFRIDVSREVRHQRRIRSMLLPEPDPNDSVALDAREAAHADVAALDCLIRVLDTCPGAVESQAMIAALDKISDYF